MQGTHEQDSLYHHQASLYWAMWCYEQLCLSQHYLHSSTMPSKLKQYIKLSHIYLNKSVQKICTDRYSDHTMEASLLQHRLLYKISHTDQCSSIYDGHNMHKKTRKITHHKRERYSMTGLNLFNGNHLTDMSKKVLFNVGMKCVIAKVTKTVDITNSGYPQK